MSQTLAKKDRLRRQADFDRVYEANVHAADSCLVLLGRANGLVETRLGLSVSRRVGNAVVRNRWKRLIREAFRQVREELPGGVDLVARPRKGARPDFAAIKASLPALIGRIHRNLSRQQ